MKPRMCASQGRAVCYLQSFAVPWVEAEMVGTCPGFEDFELWLGISSWRVICWGKGAISPLSLVLQHPSCLTGSWQHTHCPLGATALQNRWAIGHAIGATNGPSKMHRQELWWL